MRRKGRMYKKRCTRWMEKKLFQFTSDFWDGIRRLPPPLSSLFKIGKILVSLHLTLCIWICILCLDLTKVSLVIRLWSRQFRNQMKSKWIYILDRNKIAELLISYGSNLSAMDNQGNTPLHLALHRSGKI